METLWGSPLGAGLYYFLLALTLAYLEVQIEGKDGWAAGLPTWRLDGARVRKWLGKPLTGYHVALNGLILLMLHLPLFQTGFTWGREAEVLSVYFLLAVTWDFLWFMINPYFGWRRFRPEHVWWFRSWALGLPSAYFAGLALSLGISLAAAPGWGALVRWGFLLLHLALPAILVAGGRALLSRRSHDPAA